MSLETSKFRRVALASTDGEQVNQHFATALAFYVYEFDGASWSFVESRSNQHPQCGCSSPTGCGPSTFAEVLNLLHDIHLVVAARIGSDAAVALLDNGIRGHLTSGSIIDTLAILQKSPKLTHGSLRRASGILA